MLPVPRHLALERHRSVLAKKRKPRHLAPAAELVAVLSMLPQSFHGANVPLPGRHRRDDVLDLLPLALLSALLLQGRDEEGTSWTTQSATHSTPWLNLIPMLCCN